MPGLYLRKRTWQMGLSERCRGISLGLYAGDLGRLQDEAAEAKGWGCEILHFDVMDGVFVPQFTAGPGFLKGLGGEMVLDAHLMVQRPADHVAGFVAAGADIIAIHAESETPKAAIDAIRNAADEHGREVIAGVSLMPGTSLSDIGALFDMKPELVLVLALDPRNGGGVDIAQACARVAQIRDRLPDARVAFDGGVTLDTIDEIMSAAPDIVVSGSAVMRAGDRKAAFQAMSSKF